MYNLYALTHQVLTVLICQPYLNETHQLYTSLLIKCTKHASNSLIDSFSITATYFLLQFTITIIYKTIQN